MLARARRASARPAGSQLGAGVGGMGGAPSGCGNWMRPGSTTRSRRAPNGGSRSRIPSSHPAFDGLPSAHNPAVRGSKRHARQHDRSHSRFPRDGRYGSRAPARERERFSCTRTRCSPAPIAGRSSSSRRVSRSSTPPEASPSRVAADRAGRAGRPRGATPAGPASGTTATVVAAATAPAPGTAAATGARRAALGRCLPRPARAAGARHRCRSVRPAASRSTAPTASPFDEPDRRRVPNARAVHRMGPGFARGPRVSGPPRALPAEGRAGRPGRAGAAACGRRSGVSSRACSRLRRWSCRSPPMTPPAVCAPS